MVVLPYELEREIFELTARAFPGDAVKLCTISRYVQEWVEAVIYEIVVLDFPIATTNLFLRTVHSRPASFFAKTVKQLFLTNAVLFPEAHPILTKCSGLNNILCWADPRVGYDVGYLADLLSAEYLQRLSIKLEALWGLASRPESQKFTPKSFPNLSHLEIVNPKRLHSSMTIDWNGLRALPKLTHLAFGDLWEVHEVFFPHFEQILVDCVKLKVLLLVSRDDGFLDGLRKYGLQRDPRVVVKPEFNSPVPLVKYWDLMRQGGSDFWSSAEKMVASTCRQLTLV